MCLPTQGLSMTSARGPVICLVTRDERFDRFRQCLATIATQVCSAGVELRLGFAGAPRSAAYALGVLCPDQAALTCDALPGNLERFRWVHPSGMTIRSWHSSKPEGSPGTELLRSLVHDVMLESGYIVSLADDSLVTPSWWTGLCRLLDADADYIGKPEWHWYSPPQMSLIQRLPWHAGIPFVPRQGRLGVSYVPSTFLAVKAAHLRIANYPDQLVGSLATPSRDIDADILLGEAAHQLGWKHVHYEPPARVD